MDISALQLTDQDLQRVQELAHRMSVDTEFWDFAGNHHIVSLHTLVRVLGALGIELTDANSIDRAHIYLDEKPWRSPLPPSIVAREDLGMDIPVHLPHGQSLRVWITLEDGSSRDLEQVDLYVPPREIDGQLIGRATFHLPPGLPLGWHTLHATFQDGSSHQSIFAITPSVLKLPSFNNGKSGQKRAWGVMAQFYSVSSRGSWGMGDFSDLAELSKTFAKEGADFVLINPVHAAEPAVPITPSPYLPTSRAFLNVLYIRPEEIEEYEDLTNLEKDQVQVLFQKSNAPTKDENTGQQIIDRNKSWNNKVQALRMIYKVKRNAKRQKQFLRFKDEGGQDLQRFATWSCLQAQYGYDGFPPELANVESPSVQAYAKEHIEDIDFYCYLQWIAAEQIEKAQSQAKEAGMTVGIMNDLAVGVHSKGADVWCLPQAFAADVSVGAPPDMYNQMGQDWSEPPWRSDYLEQTAYAPLRTMARNAMRAAGALRIDHVMGLVRLWWIPKGLAPTEGTYVRYNHEAMVGVVMLEAARAGAFLIGEDLGTVEPWVRQYYAERGVMGTSVLWFEKGHDGRIIDPKHYRDLCLATVNTHDLPPTAGYLQGLHLKVQDELGILPMPLDQAQTELKNDLNQVIDRLNQLQILNSYEPSETELIEALHRYIGQTSAVLLGMSLVDTVGDRRMQNQPGTNNEYPNWRIPLADSRSNPVSVEELPVYEELRRLCRIMRQSVGQEQ